MSFLERIDEAIRRSPVWRSLAETQAASHLSSPTATADRTRRGDRSGSPQPQGSLRPIGSVQHAPH